MGISELLLWLSTSNMMRYFIATIHWGSFAKFCNSCHRFLTWQNIFKSIIWWHIYCDYMYWVTMTYRNTEIQSILGLLETWNENDNWYVFWLKLRILKVEIIFTADFIRSHFEQKHRNSSVQWGYLHANSGHLDWWWWFSGDRHHIYPNLDTSSVFRSWGYVAISTEHSISLKRFFFLYTSISWTFKLFKKKK